VRLADGTPLKVVRIPMPPRGQHIFGGSYTNVVFANGVLFVPSFGEIDPEGHRKAVRIYQQLLPTWKIVSVDSRAWILISGSVHCLTKNLYRLPTP
jgi:agmatine/peptidylarginine deiminase